ncbi:unnamed protein product [uncultured bacterium]|nr:unnamed protein product [uncultured bacterium]
MTFGDVDRDRHHRAPRLDDLYDIRDDLWAARMIEHLIRLTRDPSPQWGKEGLNHLVGALNTLLSRTGIRRATNPEA